MSFVNIIDGPLFVETNKKHISRFTVYPFAPILVTPKFQDSDSLRSCKRSNKPILRYSFKGIKPFNFPYHRVVYSSSCLCFKYGTLQTVEKHPKDCKLVVSDIYTDFILTRKRKTLNLKRPKPQKTQISNILFLVLRTSMWKWL